MANLSRAGMSRLGKFRLVLKIRSFYRSADQRLSKLPVRSAGCDPRITGPARDIVVDGELKEATGAVGRAAGLERAIAVSGAVPRKAGFAGAAGAAGAAPAIGRDAGGAEATRDVAAGAAAG
jgi:hypothetical protein